MCSSQVLKSFHFLFQQPDEIEYSCWISKYLKNQAELSKRKKRKKEKDDINEQAVDSKQTELSVGHEKTFTTKRVNVSHFDSEPKKCQKRKLGQCDDFHEID